MTLFKKVFQQQGRPVDAIPEGLDMTHEHDVTVPEIEQREPEAEAPLQPETDLDVYVLDASESVTPEPEPNDFVTPDNNDAWNEPDLAYVMEQAQSPEHDTDDTPNADAMPDYVDDAMSSDPVVPAEGPDPMQDEADQSNAPHPASHAPEPQTSEHSDPLDVVAFAREQMRAAGLSAPQEATPEAPALDLSQPQTSDATDTPGTGRAGRRAGRVKTRLLGFNRGAPDTSDPFDTSQVETAIQGRGKFPVGWLVVIDGPGTGHSFALFSGASMIGRGEDQVIKLDYGDNSISRQNHAAIAYDDEENKFFIGHGGKSNIIRLNARPVLSTEELHHTDLIRIGETTLRFVALCGKDFQWDHTGDDDAAAV